MQGCGGIADAIEEALKEEGADFFTMPFKIINLAARVDSISISTGGQTKISSLGYGKAGEFSIKLDSLDAPVQLTIVGNGQAPESGGVDLSSLKTVGNGAYIISSQINSAGQPAGFGALRIGGINGEYPFSGRFPSSQIRNITSATPALDLYTDSSGNKASLVKIGGIENGKSYAIQSSAVSNFRVVLRNQSDNSVAFDSGYFLKAANSAFFLARSAPLKPQWNVLQIDQSYNISVLENRPL
jgi:hypothetical protein